MSTYVKVPQSDEDLAAVNELLKRHGMAMVAVRKLYNPDWRHYLRTGKPWTNAEDLELVACFEQRFTLTDLCEQFERPPGGITSRLRKHNLITYQDRNQGRVLVPGFYRVYPHEIFATIDEYNLLRAEPRS